MNENNFIYKKEIDWSALHEGISIPVSIQVVFQQKMSTFLKIGEKKTINLLIESNTYKANIINQPFSRKKYPKHKDIIQIRYSPQSDFSKRLREIFYVSYNYLRNQRKKSLSSEELTTKSPESTKEYLVFYTTNYEDTFSLDCITMSDLQTVKLFVSTINENEFELSLNYSKVDISARIEEKPQVVKVRRLNRAIGENLKLLYNYNCQICGLNFGKRYECNIVEIHHIEPFVRSFNNNADNITIICPNHHRLMHKLNPVFKRDTLMFEYPNGLEERLKLNKHL